MSKNKEFSFSRSRGVVWVCDIKNSSQYLNDANFIDDFEEFLIRLYWISKKVIESADGVYIKWTGDGFLAWFECPIKRDLYKKTNIILEAAYTITTLVNVTKLGLNPSREILIRHGITFEEDALITKINSNDMRSTDILGRNVVLAFRLSSIENFFPNILIQGDLLFKQNKFYDYRSRIKFTKEEINKYFKGEKWGLENIYELNIKNSLNSNKNSKEIKNNLEKIIYSIEKNDDDNINNSFAKKLSEKLLNGPTWAKKVYKMNIEHLNEMFKAIKESYQIINYINKKKENE